MPAAIAVPIRKEIVERRIRGESFRQISREMDMGYDSVRAVWRHWEKHGKLSPNYANCSQPGPRKAPQMTEHALAMKRDHPRWGAKLILIKLAEEFPDETLPSERTLQRWFRRLGLNNGRDIKKGGKIIERGKEAHEVWAIDAKEKIKLADESKVSWLTITDEGSGAILDATVFPPQTLE